MVFQRVVSRFPGGSRISGQSQRLCLLKCNQSVGQKRDLFSGISENYQGPTPVLHNAMPRFLGNLGMRLGFAQENFLHGSLRFAKSIHSVGPKEFERDVDNGPVDTHTQKNAELFERSNQRLPEYAERPNQRLPGFFERINIGQSPIEPGRNTGFETLSRRFAELDMTRAPNEMGRDGRPFLRGLGQFELGRNRGFMRDNENYRSGVEQNADIVHVKIMRNNTFVTVTDSKGNKKLGASAGALAEMKGGPKVSKYSAEATAEHIGREAKKMGLKSVVVKVNGFTFFKKKKLAILSFRDGYTNSRSDKNPIVYIEDTTRKPHNGCRRKKQRRV
ncbi:hypothetical protein M8C21_019251 [Ambrosia artemisiifolia]|uniref:Ribosomal protein S11, mitochondrial n=1 Tax=Ambrosia artemisiifolia TaxID=4212 RepID=A0AAD5G1Y1_AMBAR|nr:hypothetical protein M8C21_019251 [Ambrosia artemisiifolia]